MAIEAITDRPPYAVFEMRDVEDRDASIKAGHYVGKEVAFVTVTRPGSRDTLDKEALVWLGELKVRRDVPVSWYPAFKQMYDEWSRGEVGEVNGTPIKTWPLLGKAAQKTIMAAGILSVEDLAAIADSDLANIGTGAMSMKQKAIAWLEQASGPGKTAERLAALEAAQAQLVDLTKSQAQEIERLRAFEPKPKTEF